MQNKKPYYVYDDKSVSYVEEKVTTGRIVKKVFLYLFGGVIVAAGIMAFLYYGFDTEETSQLKNRKNQLDAYMVRAEAENEELRRRVIDLENQDQRLREQILGVKEELIGVVEQDSNSVSNAESAEEILKSLEDRLKKQEKDYEKAIIDLAKKGKQLTHIPATKPVKGEILAFFGMRTHPALKVAQMHPGIDFEAREGTEVYATGDGTIKFAGNKKRSHQGNVIEINHGNNLITRYAHLSAFEVKQGQKVKRGDLIGRSGRPSNGKGPHLHYEVLRNGKHIDPLNYLLHEYTREEYTDLKKKAQLDGESMD